MTESQTHDATLKFTEGLGIPADSETTRPNRFTEQLSRMIAAFHANGDKTPSDGAAGIPNPGDENEARRTANLIRNTARKLDGTVSAKHTIRDGLLIFWIVPVREYKRDAKTDDAKPETAKGKGK